MGGKYTWLIPVFTDRKEEAATSFSVTITNDWPAKISKDRDLVRGSKGPSRYLTPHKSSNKPAITGLSFWRPIFSTSYSSCTSDINEGRGGDFLYLCWN